MTILPGLTRKVRIDSRALLVVCIAGIGAAAAAWANAPAFRFTTIPQAVETEAAPLPAVETLLLRDISPEEAQVINAEVPVAGVSLVAAKPLTLASAAQADRTQALECLTGAIYYEAATESADGQRAVAQVIINRSRHAAFPSNICGVVFQGSTRSTGCQFSFTCDGSFTRTPVSANWRRARKIAEEALAGAVFAPVGLATHYHANYVVPYWASSLVKTTVIGSHIFYRWPGQWGATASFRKRYAGGEPDAARLRATALAAELAGPPFPAIIATSDGKIATGSPAEQLATVEAKLVAAHARLGAKHPDMIALEKERRALAGSVDVSPATELKAIEARLAAARSSLGPRHPEMIELERRRAALSGASRKG